MLSRGASDASTRLRRAKSSASVNGRRHAPFVRDTIDPEIARQHAMTAANIAMDRANERASAEARRSAELSRNQSNASRTATGATPRSSNVRFCGGVPLRSQRSTLQSQAPSTASSVYMPHSNSHSKTSKAGNGPPLNEFGVVDGYGSTPSSYRRLRKTKSMLTPRKCGPGVKELSSQSPGTPRTVKSASSDHNNGLRLGLKRSMSFLKLSSGNLSKTFKRSHSTSEQNDAAVERARDQFMQDVEQQELRKKSSFLSTPRVRQQKAFRKTVRSNRTSECGDGVNPGPREMKQESKIRSFSASLRDRVRRVLGGSSSKDNKIPTQQLDASRAHFRDYLDGTDTNASQEENTADTSQSAPRRSLYVPSPQHDGAMGDLEAISASLRSMHSNDSLHSNGRSRVTSWTNSTMTNSMPARSTPVERKRLSIIQEHGGPHQPSSSIGRHMDEVSATHLQLSARNGNEQATGAIDSQRVYSALMRRIDQEQEEQHQAKTPKPKPEHDIRQSYTSSAQSFQTAPTIRQVASEESIHAAPLGEQHRQFSLHAPSWHEIESKTPQQIALENETLHKRMSRIVVPEPQSSFFPFSSEDKPQTPSPFKLALAARRERQTSSEEESGSVVITRPSVGDNGFETSSESQYSRTTSGQLLMPTMNRSDPELEDEPTGMATIIPTRVNRCPHPTTSNASMDRMNNQMTSLNRRDSKSSNSHYREGAQMDGDDTAVGGRLGSSAVLGRRASTRTVKENEIPTHERRPSLMGDRFPLLELKEVPRNSISQARRSSSVTRLASSAAADVKRASLAAIGVNDENTRLQSADTTKGLHPLRAKYSQVSFKTAEEPLSTPGRAQPLYQQQYRDRHLGRPQSSITIRSQYGRITETSGDGDENAEMHGPRPTSRLSRPSEDHCYNEGVDGCIRDASTGADGATVSRAPSRYLAIRNEYHADTALPRIGGSASKRRDHKLGFGVPVSGSRRMVSNFLRSRRRNNNAAAAARRSDPNEVEEDDGGQAFV
ncbi:hypothetical protein EPUS_00253 [Endocarpon pusillum Z07020]|uniref:Uncharacterized protein n=1 Tax=Endocarpon pusillum (strain Z07020 / HMAS-L-300199) TaxID=1263415 RepID=U1GEC1_ENDPU|nr:uncharacterized protein EPUS_00253 [Endocarpon pusillum Z07020]ERF70066.1 hypothetical protein EPUS_00253 [Endocarpon pusillum Z07020]